MALAASAVLTVVVVAGCQARDDWSEPHTAPSAIGTLGQGFLPDTPPTPEATITPSPGSWDDIRPSKGYRVVLLTAGKDKSTKTLVRAVNSWADEQDVSLKTIKVTKPADHIPLIEKAIALSPDLIISAGNDLVDPLTLVTASHLDQKFLVVGAELAEPTVNVTAADWTGASYRGEGLGMSSTYDPASFTAERAGRAIRAGVAAVLSDLTGIVIWLD
ncbi:hypothetical protein [Aeromicrobium panaciterrae]|uniref:hypothetical protein n=1 Tax=Aeromicrobium panaciterrae TaxID=363861 RepID=UPI0031E13120